MSGGRPPQVLIFAITVTGILNNTLLGPALPDILDDFDRSSSAAGVLVASASMPGVIVAPMIGLAADRFGRRLVLVPCLLTFGVFGALGALAPTFEFMVATRFLQGLGTAGLINLAVVLISDHWDGVERTRLIGRNAAVLTLALAIAPALAGALADLAGWRPTLLLYGVGAPVALVVARVLPADRPASSEPILAQLRAARTAVGHPVVRASLGSGVLVFILIFGGFLTVFPVHLEEEFSMGATGRGLMIAVPAASSSVLAFNLGRIRERVSQRQLILFAGCTYVVAFAGIAAAGAVGFIVLASIVYGAGEGIFIPSLQDAVAEAAPPDRRGAVFAVWVGAARLGQSIGPLLAGLALTATSTAGVFGLGAGLAVLLLAAQVVGPIGRTERGPVGIVP